MIPLACVMRALTILLLLSQFLASASIPQSTHTYSDGTFATVDGVALRDGNNMFVTVGTNATGQLVTSSIRSQMLPESVILQYDLNGNLRSDGQKEFGYDDANQLTSVSVAKQWKSEFLYDALGRRRITKDYAWQSGGWVETNEVRYVYDRMLVLQERDESNVPEVTYTRGLDLSGTFQGAGGIGGLLARSEISNLQTPHAYYHADGNGNVTTLTDASGNVVARYLYDPFGRLLAQSGPLAEANHYRFSSKEQHVQSGLYYYGFRFYEPSLQRWLNEDPLGEWGGMNLYGFSANSPTHLVDPYGLLFGSYFEQAGNWLYRQMMGESAGQYNQTSYGSMRADLLGGIDRNNNPLQGSIAEGARIAGDQGTDALLGYGLGKFGGIAGELLGSLWDKAKAAKPMLCSIKAAAPFVDDAAKNGPVVIGETMTRVEQAASKIPGSKILNDMPDFRTMGMNPDQVTGAMMQYNRKWILEQMRSGRQIIDIGADVNRTRPSIFYQMEQNMLKNYQKLHPEFNNVTRP